MSPVQRSGPFGEALGLPESLLPLRDADVADIPLLFASATERMRSVVIDANMHGPASSPLMNLLNERLVEDHSLDEVGTHYYNAGLVYAFLIAERKYRAGYGTNIPQLNTDAYSRGTEAVQTARQFARSQPFAELWKRVRAKEARFVGSNALSLAFAHIVPQVRKDLAALDIQSERHEEALHLGMVEGVIFLGAALRDPWESEVQEFPYGEGTFHLKASHQDVEDALNNLPGGTHAFTPSTNDELAAITRQMRLDTNNFMSVECVYGPRFGRRQTRKALAALVMEQVGPSEFVQNYKIFWVDDVDAPPPSAVDKKGILRSGLFALIFGGVDLLAGHEPDSKTAGIMALGALTGWLTGRKGVDRLRSVRVTGRLIEAETPSST